MRYPLDVDEGRRTVSQICLALPEAGVDSRTGQHSGFTVRGKVFAWYLVDHHGDGVVSFSFRLTTETQGALVDADPVRFSVAPYVGRYGWTVLDLEAAPVDWNEVRQLARESYCIAAPKKLAAAVSSGHGG